MHLDAARLRIEFRDVLEMFELKVGAEIVIDSRQQVLVEGGGYSQRIIIGFEQLRNGLQQIRA